MTVTISGLGDLDFADEDIVSCSAAELEAYADEFEKMSMQSRRLACFLRGTAAEQIRSGDDGSDSICGPFASDVFDRTIRMGC